MTSPAFIAELSISAFNYVRFSSYILVAVIVKVKVKSLSRVQLFATPWTVAYEASPSTECSRQEYWSGLPFPSPGYLPNPEIEPESPALQADVLPSEPPGKPGTGNPLQYPRLENSMDREAWWATVHGITKSWT